MTEIHGNIEGIRDSALSELKTLYDYPIGGDEFCPAELLQLTARHSAALNREISLYLSREGDVLDITIGGIDSVPLNDWHMRRSGVRLSRVRCVHTHPGGSPELSDVDISALRSLMLDAMAAAGVDENGRVTGVSAAFLSDMAGGRRNVNILAPVSLRRLPQAAWMGEIAHADEIVDATRSDVPQGPERALLVGIDTEASLDELAALADSAGAVVVGRSLQKKQKPDPVTFVGSGKAAQLQLDAQALEADVIIVDDELSGVQLKNLEEAAGVKVVDRTTLILDIFAQRAKSGEGKLQVALAQLKYRSSRLIGQGLILSRLGGGIGTRGPGESKLEIDRRRIRERMTDLRRDLAAMEGQRALRRKNRKRNAVPVAALVGYTNTGKSTLLNYLTQAGVYVQNQLFATLDAVSRKVALPGGGECLMTDTVGFISKLPTDLVEAFKSTLEEAALADVLVIVSDASSPDMLEQLKVVEEVLTSLGATQQPRIHVMNKSDLPAASPEIPGAIPISAATGAGIDRLLAAVARELRAREQAVTLLVPFTNYAILGDLRAKGRVVEESHEDAGTRVTVMLESDALSQLISKWGPEIFAPETEQNG